MRVVQVHWSTLPRYRIHRHLFVLSILKGPRSCAAVGLYEMFGRLVLDCRKPFATAEVDKGKYETARHDYRHSTRLF